MIRIKARCYLACVVVFSYFFLLNPISFASQFRELPNITPDDLHSFHVLEPTDLASDASLVFTSSEKQFHNQLSNFIFAAGLGSFLWLKFIKDAPYGALFQEGWGPSLSNKLGWVLMEVPSVLAFAGIFTQGEQSQNMAAQILASMWLTHYVYRTFVYPFLTQTEGKRIPLMLVLSGFAYNCINSYLNARWLSQWGSYPNAWLSDPRFLAGSALFALGMGINIHSDLKLIGLRKPGETGYRIPQGGLFNLISCPNYFGEILEWLGWAIASWSKSGLSFAFFTAANLVPRALSKHKWYQQKFKEDYPSQRKAVIPKVL